MKRFFSMFTQSAKELTGKGRITCIVVTALLIASSMVIEMFSIDITQSLKINFAFIAIAAIGMLYGPTISFFAGGICDILGYIVHPTGAFLPLYVFIAMLQGLIYGVVLYRKWGNISLKDKTAREKGGRITVYAVRIITARLLDVIIINLFLNTAANLHYGFINADTYGAAVAARIVKNVLELCVDIPILLIVLPAVLGAYGKVFKSRQAA